MIIDMKRVLFDMYMAIQPDGSIQLPAGAYKDLTDAQFKALVEFPGMIFNFHVEDPAGFAMKERMKRLGIQVNQL